MEALEAIVKAVWTEQWWDLKELRYRRKAALGALGKTWVKFCFNQQFSSSMTLRGLKKRGKEGPEAIYDCYVHILSTTQYHTV